MDHAVKGYTGTGDTPGSLCGTHQQIRKIKTVEVDPYAVRDPWRGYVQKAVEARKQFDMVVTGTAPGPLRDRLTEVGTRVAAAEIQIFRLAKLGDARDDDPTLRQRVETLTAQLQQATDRAVTLSVESPGQTALDEVEALRQAIDDVTDGTGTPGLPPSP